jgi:hypothetical protein
MAENPECPGAKEPVHLGNKKCAKSTCCRIAPPAPYDNYQNEYCCACDDFVDRRVPACKKCKNFCRLYDSLFYCINSECESFHRPAYPTCLEDKTKCKEKFCSGKVTEGNTFCDRCINKHYDYCSIESDSGSACVVCKRLNIPLRR